MGAICMLLVAGALEGLGRQLILDEGLRYANRNRHGRALADAVPARGKAHKR